jgi:SAM-dependent methyltransferase
MDVDLFYCMDCESFFSPFAPVHFNGPTLNHHRKVFDRNIGFTQTWFSAISSFLDSSPYVVDIGCGIGSLLFGLREQGIRGVGYDLDREATEFGFKEYHLDLRGEAWTSESNPYTRVDLITCIMVLEHIPWPRPLLYEIIKGAQKHNCPAYISVPWFNKDSWKHLHLPVDEKSPFYDPWIHVTHFSDKGFELACRGLGITKLKKITSIPWAGYFISP